MTQQAQHTPKKETAFRIAQDTMFSAISNACEFAETAMSYGRENQKFTEKQKKEVYRHMRKIARRMVKYTGYLPNQFMNEVPDA